jgi:hypothetical protein
LTNPGSFLKNRRRKRIWKVIFVNDDLGIEVGVSGISQDLDHPSFRTLFTRGVMGDFGQDNLIFPGSPCSLFGNTDRLGQPLFVGNDPIVFGSFLIATHHPPVRPLQDLENSSSLFAAPLLLREMKGDPVAMHHILDLTPGKEDIGEAGILWNEKAIPVSMCLETADDHLFLGGKAVMPAVEFHDLPVIDQGAQSVA